jgi:hypothetical protein
MDTLDTFCMKIHSLIPLKLDKTFIGLNVRVACNLNMNELENLSK